MKFAGADVMMADGHDAGRQRARNLDPQTKDGQKIIDALEEKRAAVHRKRERHRDAGADMLFEAGRPCELLD